MNRNKIKMTGFVLVLLIGCHSKKELNNNFRYSNNELSSEFIFLVERNSGIYKESMDTFSDNPQQKDIVYCVEGRNRDNLNEISVSYNQRFKADCSEEYMDYLKWLLPESLKDLQGNCIASKSEELILSRQNFIFAHCGNNAVLGTCINNHFVRINFYNQKINNTDDLKKIFRYRKW
jgi:hypothetical protein